MNRAELRARLGVSNGRTVLRESFHRAPLKIARAFPQADGSLGVCVMDASPGLLEGDSYELDWHLESGARAEVWSQGFTRVHPSRAPSTCGSILRQSLTLERGASVVLRFEPALLFADAVLRAATRVQMEAGSTCCVCEVVGVGRVERGEAWAFKSWRGVLEVEREGELIFLSRQKWERGGLSPEPAATWGARTHWGQVLAACDELDSTRRDDLLLSWRAILDASACWGGASAGAKNCVSASFLARGGWQAQGVARELAWAFEAWHGAQSRQNSR